MVTKSGLTQSTESQASGEDIRPAQGRLGVMLAGLGAVSTTFVAGVQAIRRGLAQPVGSLTQLGRLEVGPPNMRREVPLGEVVPLADLADLRFGAWDLHGENALEVARRSAVLEPDMIEKLAPGLERLIPLPAVFSPEYVRRLRGTHVKTQPTKRAQAEALRADLRAFKAKEQCDRVVVFWCGSTEVHRKCGPVHENIATFEAAMEANDPDITPSMMYAWAAIMEGCPYLNGAPNLSLDTPALVQLALREGVPVAGKDFKTGQTLLKTVLAPMLRVRLLGLRGWFSTNILGNRDGDVLQDPDSFKAKEEGKRDVLDSILPGEGQPELYGNFDHLVRINYYAPRGDAKESWDNIDLFGWLGYPMQIKVNFLARDSILAAPLVLDLILLIDLALRAGLSGPQEWLGFYFKTPQGAKPESVVENDVFRQHTVLQDFLVSLGQRVPAEMAAAERT